MAEHMTKARILVVDDDEGIRVTIEAALDDCEVTTVDSALKAVPLLAAQDYDAIISDLMMPEMTGPELYESMAADSLHRGRFLFISGGNAPKGLQSFVRLGDLPMLKKPFSVSSLRESLDLILARAAQEAPPDE